MATDATAGRLVVLCGLPGAGKTTMARALERRGAVRFDADEWLTSLGLDLFDAASRSRVEALQHRLAIDLAAHGLVAVFESGGWSRAERDALRERARAAGVAVELRFLDVPIEVLVERITSRNAAATAGSAVIDPQDAVGWATTFEPPTPDELASYDATGGPAAPARSEGFEPPTF